ncbi:hypothetical protein KIN20_030953 [Parelaphostrongylus tenuis]|uniref:Uncharacterized protein n=1 Tax=Parelaphostrongylus tenuis TaxID=148309 RepID=A0AAD5R643_PARTN|nr:hypothetical protein KIN20_030953 [Parelaphostrongylus tenuis]
MTFSSAAATEAQARGVSQSLGSAEALENRLVIQRVIDVLEQQGRAAGVPDAIITIILGQLDWCQRFYTLLQCLLLGSVQQWYVCIQLQHLFG